MSNFTNEEREILKELARNTIETTLTEFVLNKVELRKDPESLELHENGDRLKKIISSKDFKDACEIAGYPIEDSDSLIEKLTVIASACYISN